VDIVENEKRDNCLKLDFLEFSEWLKLLKIIEWNPEVDFTNNLRTAFMHADPKSAKNTVKQSVSFALLGSARLKAKHKMLVKLTPD